MGSADPVPPLHGEKEKKDEHNTVPRHVISNNVGF